MILMDLITLISYFIPLISRELSGTLGFPGVSVVKNSPVNAGDAVLSPGEPLEKETATHSNILAWQVPWTKEPGGL